MNIQKHDQLETKTIFMDNTELFETRRFKQNAWEQTSNRQAHSCSKKINFSG
jgi:hypothetical protein